MGYMRDRIGDAAMLEQLAEECAELGAELGKASLKMARIIRGENPTPVTETEALNAILEETADVLNCMDEVGALDRLETSYIAYEKRERFKARWEEAHRGSKS